MLIKDTCKNSIFTNYLFLFCSRFKKTLMFKKGDAVWVPWGPKRTLWEAEVMKVNKKGGVYVTFPGWSLKYNKWYTTGITLR